MVKIYTFDADVQIEANVRGEKETDSSVLDLDALSEFLSELRMK